MAPIRSNNTAAAARLASYKLSAAYGKAIMAGGPGEFAINCRATAPWSLKEAKKLANNLEPGVSLGYIPLAKRGLIKWDEERKSLIVPGLGSLLWVSHPDARPSDPTNIGRSKYYHCRGCIGLTVRDVVTKSADAWNRDTGHKWVDDKWFKRESDPRIAIANGGHVDSEGIWWSDCSYNFTSGWPSPGEWQRKPEPPIADNTYPDAPFNIVDWTAKETEPQPACNDHLEPGEIEEKPLNLPPPPPITDEDAERVEREWNATWDRARQNVESLIADVGQAIANLEPAPPADRMPCDANVLEAYRLVQCGSWTVEQLNKWLDHRQEQWALREQQELERLQQRHQEELDRLYQEKWDRMNEVLEADMRNLAERVGWLELKEWVARR